MKAFTGKISIKIVATFLILASGIIINQSNSYSKTDKQDEIFLKNGHTVRGIIIEKIPGESVRIKIENGEILEYDLSMVKKIKEIKHKKNSDAGKRNEKSSKRLFVENGSKADDTKKGMIPEIKSAKNPNTVVTKSIHDDVEYEDVVYLNNGNVIRGLIKEQIPGFSVKIESNDGSIFVYNMDDIEKITKEPLKNSKKSNEFDEFSDETEEKPVKSTKTGYNYGSMVGIYTGGFYGQGSSSVSNASASSYSGFNFGLLFEYNLNKLINHKINIGFSYSSESSQGTRTYDASYTNRVSHYNFYTGEYDYSTEYVKDIRTTSYELSNTWIGFEVDNTFGINFVQNKNLRLWAGPKLKFAAMFLSSTEKNNESVYGYFGSKIAFGGAPVIGANLKLNKSISLGLDLGYNLMYVTGKVTHQNESPSDMDGLEHHAFANMSVLFNFSGLFKKTTGNNY